MIYKTLHGLAPTPLSKYIKPKTVRGFNTRSSTRGDVEIPYRKTTFGQTVVSVRGGQFWNSLLINVRECPTYLSFRKPLKQFLKRNQSCDHLN